MHEPTIEVYEAIGADYAELRGVQAPERATAFAAAVGSGAVLDLGCGPGHYLPLLGPEAVGADVAQAMVDAARHQHPETPVVRCALDRLPFDRGAFAGVWASKAHQHVPAADLPLALAELHRTMRVGGRLELTVFTHPATATAAHGVVEEISTADAGDDLPGRLFTWWDPERLVEVVTHAGFRVDRCHRSQPGRDGIARVEVTATCALALPDHVGAGMRLLCCGINPSVHAAEAGVGYVTASNRFWPALVAAGLCDTPRDPRRLLRGHHIGMTDLVKRPTPRASDLDRSEYGSSFERLERLCTWLHPGALAVVGLGAWRMASGDPKAVVGWQPDPVGPTPVYVLPSTSGLNARVPLSELVHHIRTAAGPPP